MANRGSRVAMDESRDDRPGRYRNVAASKSLADPASWEDAEQEAIWRVVTEVTNAGDAIIFALTRDKGAVVVTIMSGDDRSKFYARGEAEIAELIRDIRHALAVDS